LFLLTAFAYIILITKRRTILLNVFGGIHAEELIKLRAEVF